MAYLSNAEIKLLAKTIVEAGMYDAMWRSNLLRGIAPGFTGNLNPAGPPLAVAASDLGIMNGVPRLTDGTVPLQVWLENAVDFTDPRPESKVFREKLDIVVRMASGQPKVSDDVSALPETKEKIIFRNDMLPFAFLAAGSVAGKSVARLQVPRFENGAVVESGGEPVNYMGTGWLITPDLLVTNHHVVNARSEGEPNAAQADLELQSAALTAEFDYESIELPSTQVEAARLEAVNPSLDYAVVRLKHDAGIGALRIRDVPVVQKQGVYIPVNIIQHPQGKPKRVGLRNNLITATTDKDIRYFTDTMPGSSGSPVFDDQWVVVGLHRGSEAVDGVSFQGRETAWVNVGTQLKAILADMGTRYAALAQEIQQKNPPIRN